MSGEVMTFRGEYHFLSNMYSARFEWDGRTYLNSEAAFQSAKSLDAAVQDRFSAMNGMIAKREGKKVQLRADWETVKNGIMEEVVRAKFSQNPDLLQKLLDTGDLELTEGNGWHDTYWGVDARTGKGENHLGRILMKLRSELGGTAYTERVQHLRNERNNEKQAEAAALQTAIDAVQAELSALPICDFTGMEMRTKAFGRVKILRQEENRIKFEVDGIEKTFALPACIAQGFLIPDEPAVIAAFQRRQELEEKLKSLQKNGLSS